MALVNTRINSSNLTSHVPQHEEYATHSPPKPDEDLLHLTNRNSSKFSYRLALLVTAAVWFLSGSQISLTLFTTLEPPRFPVCQDGSCNPEIPLPDSDCTTPYTYKRPGVSIVSDFRIPPSRCETRPWKNVTWVHSSLFFGILLGASILTPLCDSIGRRPIMTLGIIFIFIGSCLSMVCPDVITYGLCRCLVGIGSASACIPSVVLLSEIMPNTKRQAQIIIQSGGFVAAAASLAILTCFLPSWRLLNIMATLPALWFLSGCVCCTGVYIESPKWLAAKGRMAEAFDIWLRVASTNEVQLDESFDLEKFTKIELEASHHVELRNTDEIHSELSLMSVQQLATPDTVRKAFATFPTNIWMTIILWMWITIAMVYYGVLLDFNQVLVALNHPIDLINTGSREAPILSFNTLNPDNATLDSPLGATQRFLQARLSNKTSNLMHTEAASEQSLTTWRRSTQLAEPYVRNGFMASDRKQDVLKANLSESRAAAPRESDNYAVRPDENFGKYLAELENLLKNRTSSLLERAKLLPNEAERLYDEYQIRNQMNHLYNDMQAQFTTSDPMAKFWKQLRMQACLVLISFVLEIPVYICAMWLASKYWCGRKLTFIILLSTAGVLLFLAGIGLNQHLMRSQFILASAVFGRCLVAGAFQLLYLYTGEIVPTSIRASTIGIMSAFGRLGCMVAAPASQFLDNTQQGLTLCVFGIAVAVAGLLGITILPETCGAPLLDTLETLQAHFKEEGYYDYFTELHLHRSIAAVARRLCCMGRCGERLLNLPSEESAISPLDFESRRKFWLKQRLTRTRSHISAKMKTFANGTPKFGLPTALNYNPIRDSSKMSNSENASYFS